LKSWIWISILALDLQVQIFTPEAAFGTPNPRFGIQIHTSLFWAGCNLPSNQAAEPARHTAKTALPQASEDGKAFAGDDHLAGLFVCAFATLPT
jgi:hypothetical protein